MSPRSSGLVPSLPSLGSTSTRTPAQRVRHLEADQVLAARALQRRVLEARPLRLRQLDQQPALGRLLALVEIGLRLAASRSRTRPRCSSMSTAAFPSARMVSRFRCSMAAFASRLAQEHGLVLDLPPLDDLLVLLVVDVAAHQHGVDVDAGGRHLGAQLIVGGLGLLDAQRALIELLAVQLAQRLAQDLIGARDDQAILERTRPARPRRTPCARPSTR